MEQNTVLNGNKLIAEFMGLKYIEKCNWYCATDYYSKWSPSFEETELLFNSSWDWLMPVVEKIENNFCSSNIHYYSAGKLKQHYVVEFLGYNINYDNSKYGKSKIQTVYEAVVEFIKWYNKNK